MDTKKMNFPTRPQEKEIQVFYPELKNLPKEDYYLVMEMKTSCCQNNQAKINRLKSIAAQNGLDAIIITGTTTINGSYEKSQTTLLDVLSNSDTPPPTVHHYTDEVPHAKGIKFRSNIGQQKLIKSYTLFEKKKNERSFIETLYPINNQMPFSKQPVLYDLKINSLDFLVEDTSRRWFYLKENSQEKRFCEKPEKLKFEIFRDDQNRVVELKGRKKFHVTVLYKADGNIQQKVIFRNRIRYTENYEYHHSGLLKKIKIHEEYLDNDEEKEANFELDIEYYQDNSDYTEFTNLLISVEN
jgi:hypothetical protein